MPRTAAAAISETSSGVSPKLSYVRPQRSSRATATQGENVQSIPVAATSSAVARATRSTSEASRVQPRPTLCGKMTAPTTLLWPWTASTP